MGQQIKVDEKDIREIAISDGSATIVYFKNKRNDTLYELEYQYDESEMTSNEQYCQYCGEFFLKQAEGYPCPCCHNHGARYYDKYEVRDMVYSMLQDGCSVKIITWRSRVIKVSL